MKRMMKKFFYATSSLFTFFLLGCSPVDSLKPFDQTQAARVLQQHYTPIPTQQAIIFTLPQKDRWKKIDLSINGSDAPIMLTPINENETNWTESIRTYIIGYHNVPYATPLSLIQKQIENVKSDCTVKNVIIDTQNAQHAFYQMQLCNCVDEQDQIQFGKALRGNDAVYMIYYSAVIDKVSSSEIEKMKQAVKSAILVDRR